MKAERIKIHPENPSPGKIRHVADILRRGGLVIYPTDTVYGLGCDIFNSQAIERIQRIKGGKRKSTHLSFICYDLSHLSAFARSVDTPTFKIMKKCLPGPYTFVLRASSRVPRLLNANKKTVGIRVPDHRIPRQLVHELGNPIITTSIMGEDEFVEYSTDPGLIYEQYQKLVDVVIDGGFGGNEPSTIVDCTDGEPEVIRQGKGDLFAAL